VFGPESKPSLGLVKTYKAIAKAKNPPADNDLKIVVFNMPNLL